VCTASLTTRASELITASCTALVLACGRYRSISSSTDVSVETTRMTPFSEPLSVFSGMPNSTPYL
jgi:hypothetical protein